MTTLNPDLPSSAPAAADFSADDMQYRGVTKNSSGLIALAGAGVPGVGILGNQPRTGEQARYDRRGNQKVRLGGTVPAGSLVSTDANGKFIVAVSGAYVWGLVGEAGVVDDIVVMDYGCGNGWKP